MDLEEVLLCAQLGFVQHERHAACTAARRAALAALCARVRQQLVTAALGDPRVAGVSERARRALLVVCHDVAHRGDAVSLTEAVRIGRMAERSRDTPRPSADHVPCHPMLELLNQGLVYVAVNTHGHDVVWPAVVTPVVTFYLTQHPALSTHD
jgi:hypothetical protein